MLSKDVRLWHVLLVGCGGFLGAIARYLVSVAISRRLGTGWPWATFVINVTGCFAIGFFLTYAAERHAPAEAWRYLFPIGFVGAYTTFSTYSYETLALVQVGHHGRAASYVLASTAIGYAAVWLAMWTVRRL